MAKVGRDKVDPVISYVCAGDITALNSMARSGDLTLIRQD